MTLLRDRNGNVHFETLEDADLYLNDLTEALRERHPLSRARFAAEHAEGLIRRAMVLLRDLEEVAQAVSRDLNNNAPAGTESTGPVERYERGDW